MKTKVARFCTGCGKIRDDIEPAAAPYYQGWTETHVFLAKYGCRWADLHLLQTYCAECARIVQSRVVTRVDQAPRVAAPVSPASHSSTRGSGRPSDR